MACVRASIAVVLVACGVAAASAPAADETPGSCFPKGSRTLLQNSVARVYVLRDGDLEACSFSHGHRVALDSSHSRIYGARPPAVALTGTVVGYAKNLCGEECTTSIWADDVTRPGGRTLTVVPATLKEDALVKVGSVAVSRGGSLGWITCPERSPSSEAVPTRNPNCVRAGDKDAVYRVAAGSRDRVRLRAGRAIDPSSLRRKGTRMTWVEGGELRSARLGD